MSVKHYDINYLEGTATALKNLKEESYAPLLRIKSGTVVELGCGTGIDALHIAALLGAAIQVIGIDHDPVMVNKAISQAKGHNNIRFENADAASIAFETGSIDGLRTERLIQHLKTPEKTFAEIHRVLKPEAPVVVVETDWENFSLYNGAYEIQEQLKSYLVKDKVNNGAAARKLVGYMRSCGFNNISVQVFPFALKSLEQVFTYLMIDQSLNEMIQKNIIQEAAYTSFIKELQEADRNGYFCCTINLIIVTAVK